VIDAAMAYGRSGGKELMNLLTVRQNVPAAIAVVTLYRIRRSQ